MRTFLEARLFGHGDRLFTWVLLAGLSWLVIGLCSILAAFALFATVWYADRGMAVALFGVGLPLWFARKFLYSLSAAWVGAAAIYGLIAMLGIVVLASSLDGSTTLALAVSIPTITSALAFWEFHQEARHQPA